jgi:hypothetical protein
VLVKGSHFTATLPPDWQEDPNGTPAGGLRFLDAAYREITFSALRFAPRGEQTIEWALLDLAQQKATVARQNGATWVSEPRAAHATDLCVTHLGSASLDQVAVCLFEASITHPEPEHLLTRDRSVLASGRLAGQPRLQRIASSAATSFFGACAR